MLSVAGGPSEAHEAGLHSDKETYIFFSCKLQPDNFIYRIQVGIWQSTWQIQSVQFIIIV